MLDGLYHTKCPDHSVLTLLNFDGFSKLWFGLWLENVGSVISERN